MTYFGFCPVHEWEHWRCMADPASCEGVRIEWRRAQNALAVYWCHRRNGMRPRMEKKGS